MAKFLVVAKNNTHIDPEVDRRGCYKKGYPVVIKPDSYVPSRSEVPPNFVVIYVPEVTEEQARNYNNSWEQTIDYTVLSANPVTGTYQVEVFGNNTNVSGEAAISLTQVETYLSSWGATVDSNTTNSVTFTLALWQTLQANGFWGVDVSAFTFTLDNYDSGTGIATVTVSGLPAARVASAQQRIVEEGGLVSSSTADSVTFTINRSVVLEAFKADVKEKVQTTFCRKQYYFSEAVVDQALASVNTWDAEEPPNQLTWLGQVELTQVEALAAIQDKLAE